jgi:hypothetical protein
MDAGERGRLGLGVGVAEPADVDEDGDKLGSLLRTKFRDLEETSLLEVGCCEDSGLEDGDG